METKPILQIRELREQRGLMLKSLRERRGLTQSEFAQLLGVGQGRISDYESGRKSPGIDRLPIIATVLGVEIDDLVKINVSELA